jgi:predicted TIM-barrel fold metal-dependent hydrolase
MLNQTPVIAIEEHYWDFEMARHFPPGENKSHVADPLLDLGESRLSSMDDAGIEMQVLSHGAPAAQKLAPSIAVELTQRVNDRLAEACAKRPDRFAAFAALPTPVPEKAAIELERCVSELNFKGAMIHGLTNGAFIDDKRFWPIFEVAERLNVPLYLHPSVPHAEVTKHYYDDYAQDFPTVIRPAWGFTVETATTAIRLVLSRALEKYTRLQFILGHLGETLPFLLWRIDQALSRPGQESLSFRKQFCEHFHVTTSGFFSTPALTCTMLELGADRIMFAVDYPFVKNGDGVNWIRDLQISPADKRKLASENARRLLRL